MNVILIAVIILGVVGLVASIMLYAASKKFAVVEDERIGQVAEVLPQFWGLRLRPVPRKSPLCVATGLVPTARVWWITTECVVAACNC